MTILSKKFWWPIYPKEDARPWWLWIMLLATVFYLLFEFSFNSRLLDAVGGLTADSSIEGIEWWGRCLSGFAVALMMWPFMLNSEKIRGGAKAATIAVVSLMIVVVIFFAEKHFVEYLVDTSTPKERYAAVNLMFLQHSLVANDAEIKDLSLSHEQLVAPDGKAFLATFPFMLSSINDIDKIIRDSKIALLRKLVDQKYGGLDANFNRYAESLQKLQDMYNHDYLGAQRAYDNSIADIPRRQDKAWSDYERKLRAKGATPRSVPRWKYNEVRDEVRKSGVPVPYWWEPSDIGTFYRSVADKVKSETESSYRTGITQKAGFYLPLRLNPEQFINHREVQQKWRDMLKYPQSINLRPGLLTPAVFNDAVYKEVIEINLRQQLAVLDSPPENYRDGGKYEKEGRDNMTVILAPLIALLFSVAGAVAHVFKLAFFIIQAGFKRKWANPIYKTVAILSLVMTMFWLFSNTLESSITKQDIYKNYLYDKVVSRYEGKPTFNGYGMATAIRGAIQVQPYVYPVFEIIRKKVFMGAEFGYSEKQGKSHES